MTEEIEIEIREEDEEEIHISSPQGAWEFWGGYDGLGG